MRVNAIISACGQYDDTRDNGTLGLQSGLQKISTFLQESKEASELDEKEQAEVKDIVVQIEDINEKLNKVGDQIPQDKIDEWTKYTDALLEQTEGGRRTKRSFLDGLRKVVRAIKTVVDAISDFIDWLCKQINC